MSRTITNVSPAVERTTRLALSLIAMSALLLTLVWSVSVVRASEPNWIGRISAMPQDGLIGEWVVNGRTFVTNSSTDFRQENGAFAVDVCVEVEYSGTTSPYPATKIASKSSDNCSQQATPSPETETPEASETPGTTETPDVTGTPQATSTVDGSELEVYGKVESRPSPGLIGEWLVNGVSYNAVSETEFKQEEGPLVVGACVKIHYSGSAAPFTIREIESERSSRCTTSSATPGATSTPSATPTGESEIYGRVEVMPEGRIGDWTVNGVQYSATNDTEFSEEHGAFAVGVCVKIHITGSTTPATIREIETESDYHCGGTENDPHNSGEAEVYGVLETFPADLIGTWNVAGMSFEATSSTEFSQRNGAFAVGATVKIHFTTDANGVKQATEIETKFANDDDGKDDDGNGSFEGAEGHAYGAIDAFPAELQGTWTIAGIDYQTTSSTRFEQSDGTFAVGVNVKVEYYLDTANKRIMQKVETTSDSGGSTSSDHFKLFGFVSDMPATGFVGEWVIDSTTLTATTATKFNEEDGLLGIGSYVSVEYSITNGVKTIHEIEVHVPPGAGDDNHYGEIENKGGALNAASVQATVWVIGGVSYTVTPATDLNDLQSGLAVGETALVNSYSAADGSKVATQIRGIVLSNQVYLPLTMR